MTNKRHHHHRGVYKQQLIRREKRPPAKFVKVANDMLWDEETLRVFVDASELAGQGIFGLGACYVGQGETSVKFKKHYNQAMRKRNVYAEIVAVDHGIDQLEKVLNMKDTLPSKILVLSDWNEIERLKITTTLTKKHPAINAVAEGINKKKLLFAASYPSIELEISYLNKEEKRYNPYHTASHNAAQKVIGK